MRGSQSLFADIFEEPPSMVERSRKGRSAQLHARRNECLIDRYYFKGKFTDKRYNKIISELSEEFFISPVTIPDLINDNFQLLASLKKQQPEKSYFVKKWSHLSW